MILQDAAKVSATVPPQISDNRAGVVGKCGVNAAKVHQNNSYRGKQVAVLLTSISVKIIVIII